MTNLIIAAILAAVAKKEAGTMEWNRKGAEFGPHQVQPCVASDWSKTNAPYYRHNARLCLEEHYQDIVQWQANRIASKLGPVPSPESKDALEQYVRAFAFHWHYGLYMKVNKTALARSYCTEVWNLYEQDNRCE